MVQGVAANRGEITKLVQNLMLDLPTIGVDLNAQVEHAYDARLFRHNPTLSINAMTNAATLIMFHPLECGCDALTRELVWHG